MLFLARFKEFKVGHIPLTFVLSLRSIDFKYVFLHCYKIPQSGCISMLLS
jgi:hypothetical protein